jgi:uncharacterized protein (DUF58 family)
VNAGAWLGRLRRRTAAGWGTLPPVERDGPLLDSAFLARLEHLMLQVGRQSTSGFAGEHPSRRKSHSIEFADYRNYRPGDDFRLIDWNVYARLGQLTLRLTEAAEATTLHVLLDCSASMAWGLPSKFRTMQRLAAALGCLALARYDAVSIGVLHGEQAQILPRLRGKNDVQRLLAVLEGLEPRDAVDLAQAVASYCGIPRRGIGLLVSDLLGPRGIDTAITALRRSGLEPVVLQVLAREEAAPTFDGPLDLVDCETGVVLSTAVTTEAVRAYRERFAAWSAQVETACAAQRAIFVRLFSDQSLDDLIFTVLRGQVVQ